MRIGWMPGMQRVDWRPAPSELVTGGGMVDKWLMNTKGLAQFSHLSR